TNVYCIGPEYDRAVRSWRRKCTMLGFLYLAIPIFGAALCGALDKASRRGDHEHDKSPVVRLCRGI
ncbi:MAG TPA: hypothetical protein VF225_00575, partial [Gaiellaceae bacterium]